MVRKKSKRLAKYSSPKLWPWCCISFGGIAGLATAVVLMAGRRDAVYPGLMTVRAESMSTLEDEVVFRVAVTNHFEGKVEIVGARSTCSCTALDELPVTVPPKARIYLTPVVRLRSDRRDSKIDVGIKYYYVIGDSVRPVDIRLLWEGRTRNDLET